MKPEKKPSYRVYSAKEEQWNIITHAAGILLGIMGFVLLLQNAPNTARTAYYITVCVYISTFIWTYVTSTVYHSLYKAKTHIKNRFHLLDHTAIYLFIAGTYTPIAYFFLPGAWSWFILSAIWLLAIAGIVAKFFIIGRFIKLSTYLYLAMGWLIVIAAKPLYDTAPIELIYWIVAGGAAYSIGTFFFLKDHWKFSHAVWHLFVLAGSICHFIGIYTYV